MLRQELSYRATEPICLGLQTKTSLGVGLHWTTRSCSSIGGYICKRKVANAKETFVQNLTLTDSYGRLTSPGKYNKLV